MTELNRLKQRKEALLNSKGFGNEKSRENSSEYSKFSNPNEQNFIVLENIRNKT